MRAAEYRKAEGCVKSKAEFAEQSWPRRDSNSMCVCVASRPNRLSPSRSHRQFTGKELHLVVVVVVADELQRLRRRRRRCRGSAPACCPLPPAGRSPRASCSAGSRPRPRRRGSRCGATCSRCAASCSMRITSMLMLSQRLDLAGAAAVRAILVDAALQRRPDALPRHLDDAELRDPQDLGPGPVALARRRACAFSTPRRCFSSRMSMKSLTMTPPRSRSRSCRAISLAACRFIW